VAVIDVSYHSGREQHCDKLLPSFCLDPCRQIDGGRSPSPTNVSFSYSCTFFANVNAVWHAKTSMGKCCRLQYWKSTEFTGRSPVAGKYYSPGSVVIYMVVGSCCSVHEIICNCPDSLARCLTVAQVEFPYLQSLECSGVRRKGIRLASIGEFGSQPDRAVQTLLDLSRFSLVGLATRGRMARELIGGLGRDGRSPPSLFNPLGNAKTIFSPRTSEPRKRRTMSGRLVSGRTNP
jgi:hypothetical protein